MLPPPPAPPGRTGPPAFDPRARADRLPRARAERLLAWAKAHRLRAGLIAGGVVALLLYPFVVGALAASVVESKASDRLGQTVTVRRGRGGFASIVLDDLVVAGAPGQPPLVRVKELRIPFGVALGIAARIAPFVRRAKALRSVLAPEEGTSVTPKSGQPALQ